MKSKRCSAHIAVKPAGVLPTGRPERRDRKVTTKEVNNEQTN
jgi:hypothetical protein